DPPGADIDRATTKVGRQIRGPGFLHAQRTYDARRENVQWNDVTGQVGRRNLRTVEGTGRVAFTESTNIDELVRDQRTPGNPPRRIADRRITEARDGIRIEHIGHRRIIEPLVH